MDEDDDDLPTIVLCSPRKKKYKDTFKMPDVSVLAAQRRLEDEQDSVVTKMLEDSCLDNLHDSQTLCNDSHFSMPDADVIAVKRRLEMEEDLAVDNLLKERIIDCEDSDLNSCLEVLNMQNLPVSIPGENPGIELHSINLATLVNVLSQTRVDFLSNYFATLRDCNEERLQGMLEHLLVLLVEMYSDDSIEKSIEDIMCHAFLLNAIILDTKCRMVFTSVTTSEVLCQILEKIPMNLRTLETLESLSTLFLSHYHHFHNRLYLSECLTVKCDPTELDHPSHFTSQLTRRMLHRTLCDLVGYKVATDDSVCRSHVDLKRILAKGERSKKLTPYQQYVMLKLAYEMHWMLSSQTEDRTKEAKAKKWIVTFFNGMKCNSDARKGADFFKVKALCSRINLLWQMDSED